MRVKVEGKHLKEIVKSAVIPGARGSGSLPVLHNIKVVASNGLVTWTATDLDTASVYRIGAGIEDGAALIPFDMLQAADKARAGLIEIYTEIAPGADVAGGESVTIAYNGQKVTRYVQDVSDYPYIPGDVATPVKWCDAVPLPAGFMHGLASCLPAVSTEETRHNLQAVNVAARGLAATDGRRLHVVALPMALKEALSIHSVLAARMIKNMGGRFLTVEYEKRLGDLPANYAELGKRGKARADETAELNSSYIVRYNSGPLSYTTRYEKNSFPNYARVIPADSKLPVTVEMDAIQLAGFLAVPAKGGYNKARTVRIEHGPGMIEASLKLSYDVEGGGKAEAVICGSVYGAWNGAPVYCIGLNAALLLDAVKQVQGRFTEKGRSCLIVMKCGPMPDNGRDAGSVDAVKIVQGDFLAVLMPIRLETPAPVKAPEVEAEAPAGVPTI